MFKAHRRMYKVQRGDITLQGGMYKVQREDLMVQIGIYKIQGEMCTI